MKQPSADARPLPVQRAFVVQMHAAAAVAQGQFVGRVEHVVSGQAAHFHTLDELLAFMARVLGALDTDPGVHAVLARAPPAGALASGHRTKQPHGQDIDRIRRKEHDAAHACQ